MNVAPETVINIGREPFLAGLLYMADKQGREINLFSLTNEQVKKLIDYVNCLDAHPYVYLRVGKLFELSPTRRHFQTFMSSLIDLCHDAPLINDGIVGFADLSHDSKIANIGSVIDESKVFTEFFDGCVTALLLYSSPKKPWWRRFVDWLFHR